MSGHKTYRPFYGLTNAPEETEALGRQVGERCGPGSLVALVGELGAGKTRFVKGLAAGAGVPDASKVTSPTFVLMNLYEGRVRVAHFDLYRLEAVDLPALGFYDVLGEGAVVVEWADRAGEALPKDRLTVSFEVTGETGRRLMFQAGGPKSCALVPGTGSGSGSGPHPPAPPGGEMDEDYV